MVKTETTYSLGHDDVAQIICKYFLDEHGMVVTPEELHYNLQEYRLDEGYGGYSGDQKAQIKQIWFKR